MPGIEFKALYTLGRHSATELYIPSHPSLSKHTSFFETGSIYISQADLEITYVGQIHLEIMILLPLYPDFWDCRHVPPFLAQNVYYAHMYVYMCMCMF